jgi:hypothetical protein
MNTSIRIAKVCHDAGPQGAVSPTVLATAQPAALRTDAMAVSMTEELMEDRLKEARQTYKLNVGCEAR